MWRIGLVTIGVLVLVGVLTAGASAATISWSVPALVDHQRPFATTPATENVACPSAHLCVGLQGEGVVTSAHPDGGAAGWHTTSFLGIRGYTGAVFGALACAPATQFCAAADEVGDLMTTTNPAGGAGSWRLTRLRPRTSFSALSCPTAKLCFALDNGSVVYSRDPSKAQSWRSVRIVSDAVLESISCPTTHFCAVIASGDISAQILTSANPTGRARAWRASHFSWETTNLAFSTIACPSVRLCVASDAWGNIFTSTHPQRPGWQRTRLNGRLRAFDARSLSCPSTRLCVSVSVAGIASSTRPAGGAKTWTISALPASLDGAATVGCTRSLCVAGDSGDNLLVSARPAAGAKAWEGFNLGQGHNTFESVSCPRADLCVASDNAGNILSSTNRGGGNAGWSAQPLPSGPAGTPYSIASLSCASESLCVGISGSSILSSADPTGSAAAWSAATLPDPGLTTVSCASPSLCIAGASDGAIFTSMAPTGGAGAWSFTQLGEPPSQCGKYGCIYDSIKAISCASEQMCAATDGPNLWTSTNPGTASATWTKSQMPRSAGVLSCPAENLCVSANGEEIDATTDPTSPSPSWIVTHLPPVTGTSGYGTPSPGFISSVSCPSTQLCVAVDNVAGYAFSGNPTDPHSWTAAKIDSPLMGLSFGPIALTGVSCSSSGPCVAVDANGNVIDGSVSG